VNAHEHRAAAEEALAHAQVNPVLSADEWFLVAQVHALLAIEARLDDLAEDRQARSPTG
jgi:hypothetical protein